MVMVVRFVYFRQCLYSLVTILYLNSIFYQLYGRCLLNKVDTSSSVPDAVLFHFANSWLHMVISEKAGLCENQNLPREEMKTIVLASGMSLCLKLN